MTSKPRKRPAQQARQTNQTGPAEQKDDQAEPIEVAEETAPAVEPMPVVVRAGDGRPKCNVPVCILPEFVEGIGVCGAHYAARRGYANKLRS